MRCSFPTPTSQRVPNRWKVNALGFWISLSGRYREAQLLNVCKMIKINAKMISFAIFNQIRDYLS